MNSTTDIVIACLTTDNERTEAFSGQQVCQEQYQPFLTGGGGHILDRIVNYHDPSTLQCYKNLRFLGPIGQNPNDFDAVCKTDTQNAGLYDNQSERTTAYDWHCQPKDPRLLPRGLSVSNACEMKYHIKDAFDRLVNYNNPAGWECWVPM